MGDSVVSGTESPAKLVLEEVQSILDSLDLMCAATPNSEGALDGLASRIFRELSQEHDIEAVTLASFQGLAGLSAFAGRSEFFTHLIATCAACAIALRAGSSGPLLDAHRERGNTAVIFAATNEHKYRLAIQRSVGGANRGKANLRLKAFVIEEDDRCHANERPNASGVAIAKRFDPSSKDLKLETYDTNLSADNLSRSFAVWIRDARKKVSPVA
jgi:hypothetical protein